MFTAVIFITGAFLVSLILRTWLPSVCAICLAVTSTWLYGLFAGWNEVIVAMLMGGSAVGLMYYLGAKWPERFGFFKLPYLVTAFIAIEFLLTRSVESRALIALAGIWILFTIIYALRHGRGAKWFKKVVECCRNW